MQVAENSTGSWRKGCATDLCGCSLVTIHAVSLLTCAAIKILFWKPRNTRFSWIIVNIVQPLPEFFVGVQFYRVIMLLPKLIFVLRLTESDK